MMDASDTNMPKFRVAALAEFPAMIEMWQSCFNDSRENAEFIFSSLQEPEKIFVLADGKKILAMLSIREFSLTAPLNSCKAAYIYGVATLSGEQGKGYATTLLNDTDALLAHRKYACSVLVPAEESLFGFYEKRGFENAFNINKAEFTAEELRPGGTYTFEKIDVEEFRNIRDSRFSDSKMFACWDGEYLDHIVAEGEVYGGGTFAATIDGKQICIVCHKDGDTVYIRELGATLSTLEASFRSIHAHFGVSKYVLYLREDVKISYTNNLLPFAMIKWYDNEVKTAMRSCEGAPAYIAHVLN